MPIARTYEQTVVKPGEATLTPQTPVIGSLETESGAAISSVRLWGVLKRFFLLAADEIEATR